MKVGIVGCGNVGATTAFALAQAGMARHIVMVDSQQALAEAQAQDILHATPFGKPVHLEAGGFEQLSECRIIILACGVNQKPDESRLDLLSRNAVIFEKIVPECIKASPEAILLLATNPVDVMTSITHRIARKTGSTATKVIGSGTILDTARFRALLAEHFAISSHSVHAHVLGEHGESEVLHWSGARIGGLNLAEYADMNGTDFGAVERARIDEQVRHAARIIIHGKGATWFGIAAGISQMVQAILRDERVLVTCSAIDDNHDIAYSLPRVIGASGVLATIHPNLSRLESEGLRQSIAILRDACKSVGYA